MSEALDVAVKVLKSRAVFAPSRRADCFGLEAFLEDMAADYVIQRTLRNSVEVGLRDLPSQPTILVLSPQYLVEPQ